MIEQIIIENFRSIRLQQINLRSLNVLIGSNGAGKSNFISFFELVQNIIKQNLGGYVLGKGGANRLLYKGLKSSSYLRGLIDFSNTNAFFFRLKPTVGNKLFIDYTGDYFNSHQLKSKDYEKIWDKMVWDKSAEESDIINKTYRAPHLIDFINDFIVYHFHDTSESSPMRGQCPIGDNVILRSDASNLAAFLYRLQQTEPLSFKLIENVVKSVAPYFKRFLLQPDRNDPKYITLEWEEVGSDMYLDAYSLSDGTIRFIALATILLQPGLPSTIIIDEPELGLHPFAINKLCGLIRKASLKTQVIIATQSVNILDCFSPEDIITVDRQNSQTVFQRLDEKELKEWLEDYTLGEIWEKNVIGGQP